MTDTNGVSEPAGLGEERLEILRLVENQTVTAEEAARLLEALDRSDRARQDTIAFMPGVPPIPQRVFAPPPPRPRGRNVRIRITDTSEDEDTLNLVLPYPLLETGLKMAKRIAPDQMLDAKDIRESIDEGFEGSILDIRDGDQRVQIIVEVPETSSPDVRELREISRIMKDFGR
jgi:hypothetical protein